MSNNKEPLVSVILPSYNHAKYIRESIDSVLNQTYKNVELIITDDGSTDNSKEIILSYKDKRIKSYFFKKNKGGVYTHNYCIKQSKGEYISVLNSDDIYYPQKIERQLDFILKNKKISAVFSHAQAINENSEEIKPNNKALESYLSTKSDKYELLKIFLNSGNILIHPTALIKKEVYKNIGMYDNRLHQIPDFEYWVRMCCQGYNIKVIPEKLIQYRFRDNELNTSNGNRPDVSNRLIFEYQFLLKNYFDLKIKNISKVFENIPTKYKEITDIDKEFVIAQLLFDNQHSGYLYQSVYRLTALNKLFEIIENREIKEFLEKKYNFSYPQLIQQSGKYQLFNPNSEINTSKSFDYSILKSELDEIKDSKAWSFINTLRVFLDRAPIIRVILKKIFYVLKKIFIFLKKSKHNIKKIIILLKPIKINKKINKKKIYKLIKQSDLTNFIKDKKIKNIEEKYILFLDRKDEISQFCIDTCLFLVETFNLDCLKIVNRRNREIRLFVKKESLIKNKKIHTLVVNDDFHLIKKMDSKIISITSLIKKEKKHKKFLPFNVINPFVNLNTETKEGVIFVLPFILNSPQHLTTTIIKEFNKNNFNNFIVGTEDIFPDYLKIGDGFNELSKLSKEIYYLNELLLKDYWYKLFLFLIKKQNIKIIFNIGSSYFYEIVKKIKKEFPYVKIVDVQFNNYGHITNHIKNIEYTDIVFTESEKVKQALIQKGSDKTKIKVIKTGTNLDFFSYNLKDKKNIKINKEKLKISDKKWIISYLGRLSEEKNPQAIINIAKKFKKNDDILFLLAGDGPLKEDLQKKINQENLTNIKLVGQQDPRTVLSVSKIIILTSIIDGSPSSIRESMALGIPVISSDVGGISEMIINNKNGFLIDPNNIEEHFEIISKLKNNKDFYKNISKSALEFAKNNFDEKKLLPQYIDYINKLNI